MIYFIAIVIVPYLTKLESPIWNKLQLIQIIENAV